MRINDKGKLVYVDYGSIKGYECIHCAHILLKPANKAIYSDMNVWYVGSAGRKRCAMCNNLARWF